MYPTFPRSSGSAEAKLLTSSSDQLTTFFIGREKRPLECLMRYAAEALTNSTLLRHWSF